MSGLIFLLFSHTPSPFIAINDFFKVGIMRNDVCGWPFTNLATEIDQNGMPAAKLVVPSKGSTIQKASPLGIVFSPSSLRTPSLGAIFESPFTIVWSLHKSQRVIRDPSALLVDPIFPKSFNCLLQID